MRPYTHTTYFEPRRVDPSRIYRGHPRITITEVLGQVTFIFDAVCIETMGTGRLPSKTWRELDKFRANGGAAIMAIQKAPNPNEARNMAAKLDQLLRVIVELNMAGRKANQLTVTYSDAAFRLATILCLTYNLPIPGVE